MLAAQIGKAILLGLLGWAFPRFLVAAGVPLDKWIEAVGMNAEVVFGGFALVAVLIAFWAEGKYSFFERLFYAARPVRLSDGAAMQFIARIEAAQSLMAESPERPLDRFWHQRVIQWNTSVEDLIRRELSPRELFGYRTINVPPALDQSREIVFASLSGRHAKLRIMAGRLLPPQWDRRIGRPA